MLALLLVSQSASREGQLAEDGDECSRDAVADCRCDLLDVAGSGSLAALIGRGVPKGGSGLVRECQREGFHVLAIS